MIYMPQKLDADTHTQRETKWVIDSRPALSKVASKKRVIANILKFLFVANFNLNVNLLFFTIEGKKHSWILMLFEVDKENGMFKATLFGCWFCFVFVFESGSLREQEDTLFANRKLVIKSSTIW